LPSWESRFEGLFFLLQLLLLGPLSFAVPHEVEKGKNDYERETGTAASVQ